MSKIKKAHRLLISKMEISDVVSVLVESQFVSVVTMKEKGCTLKYKKSYDTDNVVPKLKTAYANFIKENKLEIQETLSEHGLSLYFLNPDNNFIEKNLDISYNKDKRHIYINYNE